MSSALLIILITLVVIPLAMAIKHPVRIFEFPFFMAFAFGAFILPQAYSLIRFPGFLQDSSVTAVLLMSCLCLGACFVGYQLAPSALMLRWASKAIDLNRLFRVGVLFIGLGYALSAVLGRTEVQYSVETGGMTGSGTILLFFEQLVYPGFAIALFCALRRPTFSRIAACAFGIYLPLKEVIFGGRRENTAVLLLTIAMGLFYERRVNPPRLVLLGVFIFSLLAIPATSEYRAYAATGDWDSIRSIDLVGNFKHFVSEESVLELRNGAAVIEATRQTGNYQFGKAYWNHLVFRFVPAQLTGSEFKDSLMFNVWDVIKNGGSETGVQFYRGTTITGMGDTFLQFGWLGCAFFGFMAVLFKGMWQASLARDAMFARLMFVMSFTSGMRAVTHWTLDFLPGLFYFAIFLGIAGAYAQIPHKRSEDAKAQFYGPLVNSRRYNLPLE